MQDPIGQPVARSQVNDRSGGREATLYIWTRDVKALLIIRQENVVMAPSASVFGVSASWVSRRVKAATKIAPMGDEYSGHSMRMGVART